MGTHVKTAPRLVRGEGTHVNKQHALEKKTMVVAANFHCKRVIVTGTIFYRWNRYNIVKSTIIVYLLLFF